jgi:acylphosphatase
MPKDPKRLHVIFKGRVQGVGFRYTCEGIAMNLGVKGWVRNLPNGDVEITAEGDQVLLESLLLRINNSPVGKHVLKTVKNWQPCLNEFSEFRVEFF